MNVQAFPILFSIVLLAACGSEGPSTNTSRPDMATPSGGSAAGGAAGSGGDDSRPIDEIPTEPYDVDFGSSVHIFDPTMDISVIQEEIDVIHAAQAHTEFGEARHALLFQPGVYDGITVDVGYHTQALGLGRLPSDVVINGTVQSITTESGGNITTAFWRGAENFTINPPEEVIWAVSQASPFRRIHVKGNLYLDMGTGFASGGFLADSVVDGVVTAYNQQQWFTRNSDIGSWTGVNWNVMWLGVEAVVDTWGSAALASTVIERTPRVREKPFLFVDEIGNYNVFVPELRADSRGASWGDGEEAGTISPLSSFHVARPEDDDADTLNAALAAGKHLFFTPGIYNLTGTINVDQPGTIVYGLGLPTLVPGHGGPAISTADVDGLVLVGLTVDAGPSTSPTLFQIGEEGSTADHSSSPSTLHDIYCRVGGQTAGHADACVTIHSHDVIADHFWLWRADHGLGADWADNGRGTNYGWDIARAKNGLVVHGDDVTIYGLFNEHFQEYQTLWLGERGATYFYQSEIPYDPPDQASWSDGDAPGYASYKVDDDVQEHQAWGLGMYSFFDDDVRLENAMEVPNSSGIEVTNIVTFNASPGGINHLINGIGDSTDDGIQHLPSFQGTE